jgi:hypothetical protein
VGRFKPGSLIVSSSGDIDLSHPAGSEPQDPQRACSHVSYWLALAFFIIALILAATFTGVAINNYTNNGASNATYALYGHITYYVGTVQQWNREYRIGILLIVALWAQFAAGVVNFFVGNNDICGKGRGCSNLGPDWKEANPTYYNHFAVGISIIFSSVFVWFVANISGITDVFELMALSVLAIAARVIMEDAGYRRHENDKAQYRVAAMARALAKANNTICELKGLPLTSYCILPDATSSTNQANVADAQQDYLRQVQDAISRRDAAKKIAAMEAFLAVRDATFANLAIDEYYSTTAAAAEAKSMSENHIPGYNIKGSKNNIMFWHLFVSTGCWAYILTAVVWAYSHQYVNLTLAQHALPWVYFAFEGASWFAHLFYIFQSVRGQTVNYHTQHAVDMIINIVGPLITCTILVWFSWNYEHDFVPL